MEDASQHLRCQASDTYVLSLPVLLWLVGSGTGVTFYPVDTSFLQFLEQHLC